MKYFKSTSQAIASMREKLSFKRRFYSQMSLVLFLEFEILRCVTQSVCKKHLPVAVIMRS